MNGEERDRQALELGKKLLVFYESGYVDRKQALAFAFLKGLAAGLGAFLGGTIVIALLLWILSQFGEVPLLGPVVDSLRDTLDTK